ncbi:MAG TPA: CHRD domain-containing protein, partial [Acidimicrobiia bacterium]
MLRRFFKIGMVSMLIVASTPLTASAHGSEFEADLDPGQEVQTPAVVSDGEGEADFTLKRNKVRFRVEWDDLTSGAVAGHIHCAPAGSNGTVGVTLLSEPKGTDGKVRG